MAIGRGGISRRQSLAALGAGAVLPIAGARAATAPPKIRLVILDVGGTLIQDHGEVPEAMMGAFATGGVTVTAAEIADWRGASKRELIRRFVELRTPRGADRAALTESIFADFAARANRAYADVRPIAGAEDALREMQSRGLLLAATTGFDRQLCGMIFSKLGWQERFVATVTSDDVVDGRPSPFMIFHAMETAHVDGVAEVVAVGDTALDLQAAANGGVRGAVGVFSGAASRERLEREPHTHILASVAELPDLLRRAF